MKTKLLHCAILVVTLFVLNIVLQQVVVPQNTADLALQQLNEDGSREQLRVAEQLSNWITTGLVLIGIVGLVVIWGKPARKEPADHERLNSADTAARSP